MCIRDRLDAGGGGDSVFFGVSTFTSTFGSSLRTGSGDGFFGSGAFLTGSGAFLTGSGAFLTGSGAFLTGSGSFGFATSFGFSDFGIDKLIKINIS